MKTKLFAVGILITINALAQETPEPTFFRPLQGDKTISFNFVGINTIGLQSPVDPVNNATLFDFRYFYKDDLAFRFGFGVRTQNQTTSATNDTTGGVPLLETTNEDKTSSFSIGIGIEKHLKTKSKRVDPYAGFAIYRSNLGDRTVTNTTKTTQVNHDYNQTETITITPGSGAWSFYLNGGFFWYFAHNLAFGGEILFGYATGTTGGDITVETTTTTSVGGAVTTTKTNTSTVAKLEASGFATKNLGVLTLLIKF